jgi:predicted helicase
MRQTKEGFGVFVAGSFCGHKLLGSYDSNNVFPVFDLSIPGMSFVDHRVLRANLNETWGAMPSDLELLNYTYATFHSPNFRKRYSEFLKIEFPRLALTGNKRLFLELSKLGNELTALHLLNSENLYKNSPEFIGKVGYEIEKISWSANTVWIDKAQMVGFKGVREDVWNFHVGGYQVCEKWLKDRKGRKLTKDDIEHYQKIVVALSETIRLMAEIDKVIDEHGGWPGAFQATK